ncbi:hypothetical protein LCGC14_1090910 [marine sediment metagenome]|uniref:Uncharacterized protein n=1 Tax=marine sediment metagenome TaxID=412755 RepID=A0A0F9MGV0_9ZZZZ
MPTEVVKTLEGRELELVTEAVMGVQMAQQQMQVAQLEGQKAQAHFNSVLEIALGMGVDGLTFNAETGEVTREKRARKPRSRGTTKGGKKGAAKK